MTEKKGRNWVLGDFFELMDPVLPLSEFLKYGSQSSPTPVFLPGEFHGQGDWQATVHGVAKSWTRLSNFHVHFHFHFSHVGIGRKVGW